MNLYFKYQLLTPLLLSADGKQARLSRHEAQYGDLVTLKWFDLAIQRPGGWYITGFLHTPASIQKKWGAIRD